MCAVQHDQGYAFAEASRRNERLDLQAYEVCIATYLDVARCSSLILLDSARRSHLLDVLAEIPHLHQSGCVMQTAYEDDPRKAKNGPLAARLLFLLLGLKPAISRRTALASRYSKIEDQRLLTCRVLYLAAAMGRSC